MRKIWRTALIGLLLLGVLGAAGVEYLNRYILPVKAKGAFETFASDALARKVTVGRVRIHLWHGILLENLEIQEDARYGKGPFLKVDRISAHILYLPFFKKREIIIPTLRIARPRLQLIQDPQGLWNFQSLRLQSPRTPSQRRFHLVIPRIVLSDGAVEIEMREPEYAATFQCKNIDAQARVASPDKIRWLAGMRLVSSSEIPLKLSGTYAPSKRQILLQAQAPLRLKAVRDFLPREMLEKIPSLEGQGDVELQFDGTLAASQKSAGFARWAAVANIKQMNVSSIPYLGEVKQLSGRLEASPGGWRLQQLSGFTASGRPLTAAGFIRNDAEKSFSLDLKTTAALSELPALPQKLKLQIQSMHPQGQATLELTAEGSLHPALTIHPVVTGNLQDVSLKLPPLGTLEEVRGTIRWQPDLLTVTNLEGRYRSIPFSAEGSLVNFVKPEIDFKAAWGKLNLESQITLDEGRAQIHSALARYRGNSARILGEAVGVSLNGIAEDAAVNLYGESVVELSDLPELAAFFPHSAAWMEKFPLKGVVSTRWLLEGPVETPNLWKLMLKNSSDKLTLHGLEFNQAALEAQIQKGACTVSAAQALVAGGRIELTGSLETHKPRFPWNAQVRIQSVELAKLAQQLRWKTEDLSGELFIDWQGQGMGTDPASIQGKGKLQVLGGRIMELPLLGRFADFLGLPTLRTLPLQETQGAFTVADGAVQADALQIRAPQATLNITGTGGFLKGSDSPVNWRVIPTLAPELIPEETRAKIGKVIAKGASYFIGEIRITGTWNHPKRSFVPKPIIQILNEQLFNLQDLLKDLF